MKAKNLRNYYSKAVEKRLEKNYVGKRFTKLDLECSLNVFFELSHLKDLKQIKLNDAERFLYESDDRITFTYYLNKNYFFDVDIFYLKTNQLNVIFITEFNVEGFDV